MSFRFLYIFPHPDDESFGPAAAMYSQLQDKNEVFLLTLTKGGATKQRHRLGASIEEMGEIRYKEMLEVKHTLKLTGMEVLDLPDGGLKEIDPRIIENIVKNRIERINPDVIISYPVHGISAFHDHLVTHAVVKRVFCELMENKSKSQRLKRLAFFTLKDNGQSPFAGDIFKVRQSGEDEIDCVMPLTELQLDVVKKVLHCYSSYQQVILESNVLGKIGKEIYFEFFNENVKPPVSKLEEGL